MHEHGRASSAPSAPARLALLAVVLVAGAIRWQDEILDARIKPDETVYVSAAKLWCEGRSPYEESHFFYTPVFAWAGAELTERYGTVLYLQVQRALTVLGICLATWLAVLVAGWSTWPALLACVLWICLAPAVALPIEIGNATGLPTALTLAALWGWCRRPGAAGVSLGLAQAIKPIAPLAALGLLAHRAPADRLNSRRAGVVAIGVSGLLLLVGLRFLPGIFDNAGGSGNPYNFSLQHLLAGLGLEIRPIWITAIVGAGGLWWISQRLLSRSELLVAIVTLNLLAAPLLWAHSLLLFLPVQLLAARRMAARLRRLRSSPSADRGRPGIAVHVFAGLALISTIFSAAAGGLASAPAWLQSIVLAVPYLSLLYLGVYCLGNPRDRDEIRQSRASQPA